MRPVLDVVRGRRPAAAAAPTPQRPPLTMQGAGMGYLGGASDEQLLSAMGAVSTLFAIVERLQTSVASVEWNLWKKSASGDKSDRKLVKSHAALDLWRKPNAHIGARQFREISQQHIELTGVTPWLVAKFGSIPVELWPVRPDRLVPQPDPDEFISNYWYTGAGIRQWVDVDCVVRQVMPHPMDWFAGLSAVQPLLVHLRSMQLSQAYTAAFYENNATPGGMLTYPDVLTDDELREVRTRWDEQHRGVRNANRVAILERGMDWKERTYTMRDMQFAELSELSREIVREGFGFPKSMLGSVQDVNRANAEAGEVVYGRWLVVPRLDRTRDALNTQLLPMYGPSSAADLEFDYVAPIPEDRAADNENLAAKVGIFKMLVDMGVDPLDACRLVGLPPIEITNPPAAAAAPATGEDTAP